MPEPNPYRDGEVACHGRHGYFFIFRSNQPAIVPTGSTNTQMATCVVPTPSPDRVALAAASAPTARGVRTTDRADVLRILILPYQSNVVASCRQLFAAHDDPWCSPATRPTEGPCRAQNAATLQDDPASLVGNGVQNG